MKEFQTQLIEFIKGLMQPGITIFAVLTGAYLVFGDKIASEQAWWLVVGIFGFWFGKTVGLFGNGKAPESIADTNKDLISVIKGQQNVINNQSIDLGASVPVAVVEGKAATVTQVTTPSTTTVTADTDNPDAYLTKLTADLEAGNV